MHESVLDEVDLRLLNAIQISPRASWATLAPVVGVDAVTIARRWERLSGEGWAWVTAHPAPPSTAVSAIVELECPPGQIAGLARDVAALPAAFNVDLTAGNRDMIATVVASDMAGLTDLVYTQLGLLAEVRTMRTHVIGQLVTDARQWRLRVLHKDEVKRLHAPAAPSATRRASLDPQLQAALTAELWRDGRVSAAELSRRLDVTPRRVRDGLAVLLDGGRLVLRTDVAQHITAWPVTAWYFLRVPADQVDIVSRKLAALDEVRLVTSTLGRHNVIMTVWLHGLDDVQRLEAAIESRLPGVSIEDRSLTLRRIKVVGRLLDDEGRATGHVVPMAR